jgi:hypothetical protein
VLTLMIEEVGIRSSARSTWLRRWRIRSSTHSKWLGGGRGKGFLIIHDEGGREGVLTLHG